MKLFSILLSIFCTKPTKYGAELKIQEILDATIVREVWKSFRNMMEEHSRKYLLEIHRNRWARLTKAVLCEIGFEGCN